MKDCQFRNQLSRRRFLGFGTAVCVAPWVAKAPMASAAPPSLLARYPWRQALALWHTLPMGELRSAYITLASTECPGLGLNEVAVRILGDFLPLVSPSDITATSRFAASPTHPATGVQIYQTRNGAKITVTLRKSRPMPPILRGEYADMEVREDEVLVLDHGIGSLSIPLEELPRL